MNTINLRHEVAAGMRDDKLRREAKVRFFMRFAIGFLVVCFLWVSLVYFFGPESLKQSMRHSVSPVGQLNANDTLTPTGQTRKDTTSGSTSEAAPKEK